MEPRIQQAGKFDGGAANTARARLLSKREAATQGLSG